jgi:hypothetical protein
MPSPRYGASLAYNPADGYLVLFGGCCDAYNRTFSDTWVWNGQSWRQLNPSASPSARKNAGLAYDMASKRLVLFGGCINNQYSQDGDTWAWDGSTWTQITSTLPAPHSQCEPAMVSLGTSPNAGQASILLFGSDGTGVWQNGWWRRPPTTGSPSFRRGAALTFDPLGHQVLLFGGVDTTSACGCILNDTWAWTGLTWVQQHPASQPTALSARPRMVYDAAAKRSILFQSVTSPDPVATNSNTIDETWSWNGSNWTQLQPANSPWIGTHATSMAYDAATRQVLIFGGGDGADISLDDTWILMPMS